MSSHRRRVTVQHELPSRVTMSSLLEKDPQMQAKVEKTLDEYTLRYQNQDGAETGLRSKMEAVVELVIANEALAKKERELQVLFRQLEDARRQLQGTQFLLQNTRQQLQVARQQLQEARSQGPPIHEIVDNIREGERLLREARMHLDNTKSIKVKPYCPPGMT